MGIKYYKLLDMLNRKGMKKTDLLKIMSSSTLAKLSTGKPLKTTTIEDICEFLDCQPGDIMEYIPDPDEPKETMKEKIEKATIGAFEKGYKIGKEAPTVKEAFTEIGEEIKNAATDTFKK